VEADDGVREGVFVLREPLEVSSSSESIVSDRRLRKEVEDMESFIPDEEMEFSCVATGSPLAPSFLIDSNADAAMFR